MLYCGVICSADFFLEVNSRRETRTGSDDILFLFARNAPPHIHVYLYSICKRNLKEKLRKSVTEGVPRALEKETYDRIINEAPVLISLRGVIP